MPVNPPYSIIGEIARISTEGAKARAAASAQIGSSIGQGISDVGAGIGQANANQKQAQAKQYHDNLMQWDNLHDTSHDFGTPVQPGSAAVPTSGVRTDSQPQPGILSSSDPAQAAPNMSVNPVQDRSVPQPGAPQPNVTPLSGQTSQAPTIPPAAPYRPGQASVPAAPAKGPDRSGQVNMADWMRSRGSQPTPGMEKIWGTPKITGREESAAAQKRVETTSDSKQNLEAAKIAGRKELLEEQAKEKADAAKKLADSKTDAAILADKHKKEQDELKSKQKDEVSEKANHIKKDLGAMKKGSSDYKTKMAEYTALKKMHPWLPDSISGLKEPEAEKSNAAVGDFLRGISGTER